MEAVGATASIVGIVSFGLSLAKTLQAFIDSVIEAEETITLIVADVNATASTLKRLQDFIDQDKTTSQEQHRATVFNNTGIGEISALALQCHKVYVQIIVLIEKASTQIGEDRSFVRDLRHGRRIDTEKGLPALIRLGYRTAFPTLRSIISATRFIKRKRKGDKKEGRKEAKFNYLYSLNILLLRYIYIAYIIYILNYFTYI